MKANPPGECLLAGEAPGCWQLGESQCLLLVPRPPPRGLADSWENKIKIPDPPSVGAALLGPARHFKLPVVPCPEALGCAMRALAHPDEQLLATPGPVATSIRLRSPLF